MNRTTDINGNQVVEGDIVEGFNTLDGMRRLGLYKSSDECGGEVSHVIKTEYLYPKSDSYVYHRFKFIRRVTQL